MSLVTAVITTHKREPEIVERALKSILSQTYINIETIVVDDSPEDYAKRSDVQRMVESYSDNNVRYIQHNKCMGACVARNTGLEASNGDFIAFLDDDDEWKPEKIEKQLAKFESPSIGLVYCGSETFNEDANTVKIRETKFISGKIYEQLIINNFIGSTSFPLLRKRALEEIGGFDPLMQSAQDYDVWLRISKLYEVDFVEDILVRYYVHQSERITSDPKKKISGLERIIEKNYEHIKINRQAYWSRTMELAPFYAANMQFFKAFSLWFKAVLKCPEKLKKNIYYARYIYLERFVNTRKKKR
ncbi:MAG: glycosyltransferase family 2 protein [Ruminococcaceae bacterium]|nr:glycosyltransferase family 2 protein [Oscillospiraceae bacterium]